MNDINSQNYIQEMERNSKIFEEKMNRLNSECYENNNYSTKKEYNTFMNNSKKSLNISPNNPFKLEKNKKIVRKYDKANKKLNLKLNKIKIDIEGKENNNKFIYNHN